MELDEAYALVRGFLPGFRQSVALRCGFRGQLRLAHIPCRDDGSPDRAHRRRRGHPCRVDIPAEFECGQGITRDSALHGSNGAQRLRHGRRGVAERVVDDPFRLLRPRQDPQHVRSPKRQHTREPIVRQAFERHGGEHILGLGSPVQQQKGVSTTEVGFGPASGERTRMGQPLAEGQIQQRHRASSGAQEQVRVDRQVRVGMQDRPPYDVLGFGRRASRERRDDTPSQAPQSRVSGSCSTHLSVQRMSHSRSSRSVFGVYPDQPAVLRLFHRIEVGQLRQHRDGQRFRHRNQVQDRAHRLREAADLFAEQVRNTVGNGEFFLPEPQSVTVSKSAAGYLL